MYFNANNCIRVKLNEYGRHLHYRDHADFWDHHPRAPEQMRRYKGAQTDADGWSQFQLWDWARIFGPHLGLGARMPFDSKIIIEDADTPKFVPVEEG